MKLQLRYIYSLRSLSAVNDFVFNSSAFLEGLEAFHVQSGIVYEYIVTILIGDEAITFLVVEPFYCTFVHNDTSKNEKLNVLVQNIFLWLHLATVLE